MKVSGFFRSASLLLILFAVTLGLAETVATRRIQAHLTFLADDLLEGRGTGTRGHALAMHYVAAQFARCGIAPGADGRYLQPIRLLESTSNREAGRLTVRTDDREDVLTPISDMYVTITPGESRAEVMGPAVFVGFGVQAPDLGYDDFAGVNLKGKIAVLLSGAPKRFPSAQRAHHASNDQKRRLLVQHGAIGVVSIQAPWDETRRPWALTVALGRFPTMRLLDATGAVVDGYPELRASGVVSFAAAGRVLGAAAKDTAEIFAVAERGEAQAFPLNCTITLAGESTLRPAESANVLGWLPGSDPALEGEPIVITGHLDHLGIGVAVNGDSIYNGAVDNALGIGVLLHIAEELSAGPRLRRPVLIAALTGEEKGLLGSKYLADHPPARISRYAAALNIDMPLLSAPARNLVAYGADHSTLGATLVRVAARHGLIVSPDPAPEEVRFVRSDQYPFVLRGVPAMKVDPSVQAVDPTVDLAAAEKTFRRDHYHKPSDDLSQPINWPAADRYAALMLDLVGELANDPTAPAWLPGDFFGGLFGPKQ